MWVKVADRDEIGRFEITPEANKVQTQIGETPDNFIGAENDLGIMLLCKVPSLLKSFIVFLEDDREIDVECWQYGSSNNHLVYSKQGIPGFGGTNIIECSIFLSPGKYFLRVRSRAVLVKSTSMINTSHHFLSVVGGSALTNGVIPAYQELLKPTVWFGIYDLKIEVANKSLYLGVTDKILDNKDLIPGAFYHYIKSAALTLYVFDGTQQCSIT